MIVLDYQGKMNSQSNWLRPLPWYYMLDQDGISCTYPYTMGTASTLIALSGLQRTLSQEYVGHGSPNKVIFLP